jgi:hypothetical protein
MSTKHTSSLRGAAHAIAAIAASLVLAGSPGAAVAHHAFAADENNGGFGNVAITSNQP